LQDILREKIERGARIQDFFPEYAEYTPSSRDEVTDEYTKVRCFIRDKFRQVTKKRQERSTGAVRIEDSFFRANRSRELFCHFTTATDTDNIKRVFDDVHTMIIMNNLKKISIA
jgi:guanine nucleotide-binding protein subunit alpha